jgi:hypothetical protein
MWQVARPINAGKPGNEDTGETFTSTNINAKEAYEELLKKYE